MNTKKEVFSPIGVALWLVENTSLSFTQIAEFCKLHEMEVKSIADGMIAANMNPVNPVSTHLLLKEEIEAAEKDLTKPLKRSTLIDGIHHVKQTKKPKKYTTLLQRRNRIDCILWLVTFAPELSDARIVKILNTTKDTVEAIRNKTYNGYANLTAKDPVIMGFISQSELDYEIQKAKVHNKDTN